MHPAKMPARIHAASALSVVVLIGILGCGGNVSGGGPVEGKGKSDSVNDAGDAACAIDTSPLSNDGSDCYGACGSGCSQCYTSTVDLPYTCGDGSSGTQEVERLVCPTASCCAEHDGCTRGCGWDPVCQAGCQADAIANGCAPGVYGGNVPDESWAVYATRTTTYCAGQCPVQAY